MDWAVRGAGLLLAVSLLLDGGWHALQARQPSRRMFVDAVEEGVARVVSEDSRGGVVQGALPAALLPPGVGEGQWIEIRGVPPPGRDAAGLRRSLGRGDSGGDLKL